MSQQPLNVLDGFWNQVRARKDNVALGQKKNGSWETWSWTLVGEKVAQMATAFKNAGLKPGDKVAIFSENTPEWIITDFAAMAAGLVTVPLYATQTDSQVQYIIEHSETKLAVARGKAKIQKLLNLTGLLKIVEIDDLTGSFMSHPKVTPFEEFLKTGDKNWEKLAPAAKNIDLNSLATIVYTSGTTANPKGVMLTHQNHIAQSEMIGTRTYRTADDIIMSYLPLSHITERINIYRQAVTGYAVYTLPVIDTVANDLKEIRPTSFVAVPRVWEKFQEAIQARVQQAPPARQRIFAKALAIGRKHYEETRKNGKASFMVNLRFKILQRLVGKKLKAAMGFDRCKFFISGAAPLSPETSIFFYSLGIPIIEGYGLTECAGASHINLVGRPIFGTVGPHLDGLECKIAEDGEILLRGQNVFAGYYKEPAQTAESLINGWLHTGDIGKYDENGCLRITDRKKNIIVTSGGKNVAPAPLEAKLKNHRVISQVLVIGDKRKYLTALITLNPGVSKNDAEAQITAHLAALNATLPSYETIKKFAILDKDFTVESGELTPTMKAKRGFIQEKYKSLIDGLYQQDAKANAFEVNV
ncbi:MAG TPA: long-chain fatty acid--CoA ligase [Bdellovibrionales bacterium]|nr:long-chain fatty acid--CoA ligase [Bdellovibrionales bacterium]